MEHSGARVQAIHSVDNVRGKRIRRRCSVFNHVMNPKAGILWISAEQYRGSHRRWRLGIMCVPVFFLKGVAYVERTGLPWGVTQEEFDNSNSKGSERARYRSQGLPSGVTQEEFDRNNDLYQLQKIRPS